jgi:Tfp pilus assembly protein PilN
MKSALVRAKAFVGARPATALGIDIGETHINLALLKKDDKGIKLVKTAQCPLPEGTIKSGSLQDQAALLKAIRQLKSRNHIRARAAAVSLPAGLVLMQIVELPKQMPPNIGHFVQDEVKQYVALSGEKIISDFCNLSTAHEGSNKILVAASDRQKVAGFVSVCSRAGINVDIVEPAMLAFIRACYAKKITAKFNYNMLLALVFGDVLTLCVFRKQTLDLIRTKNLQIDPASGGLADHLAEQINAVTQYYDIEHAGELKGWHVTTVIDTTSDLTASLGPALKAKLQNVDLEVMNLHDAAGDTPFALDVASQPHASGTAIGLAMRLLSTGDPPSAGFKVNLLPKEAIEARLLRKHILVTANIVAVVLLATMLIVHIVTLSTSKVNQSIQRKIQSQPPQSTSTLVQQEKLLNQQIEQMGEGPHLLNELITARRQADWAGLLSDIGNAAPHTVCITRLSSRTSRAVSLQGLATSYDAANMFVNMLEKSEHILSVSLLQAQKDKDQSLVRYEIDCSLVPPRGN